MLTTSISLPTTSMSTIKIALLVIVLHFDAPNLRPAKEVMRENAGTDKASLWALMKALAKKSIFGREELIKGSLSGRKNTEVLDYKKMSYFKPLVRPRISDKYHLLSLEQLQKLIVPGTTHTGAKKK